MKFLVIGAFAVLFCSICAQDNSESEDTTDTQREIREFNPDVSTQIIYLIEYFYLIYK